jgi:hypothetical protein
LRNPPLSVNSAEVSLPCRSGGRPGAALTAPP